jgi:uncharacterized membrane protein
MTKTILQICFVLLFPVLTLYARSRSKFIRFISPIVVCYFAGILAANLNLNLDNSLMITIMEISVALAIPLLLFSSDFLNWLKHSKMTFLSFFLGVLAVVGCSFLAFFLFKDQFPQAYGASGMLIGVYTGGTQNMSAIGLALKIEEEIFILLNCADVVFGAVYFVFLMTLAKKFFGLFLPKYKSYKKEALTEAEDKDKDFVSLSLGVKIKQILVGLFLSVLIFAVAAGASLLIKGALDALILILVLTSLGIGASFITKVRSMKASYPTAEYLLLVFAVSIGSQANIKELLAASSIMFIYTGFIMFGAIIIHAILGMIFRIDADTLIITSAAGIYGPAFIGPVANGIKNQEVIVPGIAMGLLGYAIGNYIGIAVAMILK